MSSISYKNDLNIDGGKSIFLRDTTGLPRQTLFSDINNNVNLTSNVGSIYLNSTTDIHLNTLGSTYIDNTIASSLILAGGLSISNTADAVSFSSGGSFTSAGGIAIKKSLYVGTNSILNSTTTSDLTSTNGIISTNGSQNTVRFLLSGQEFYTASNSSINGVAMLLGVNRTGNRQLWIGDSANLVQNSINTVIRISSGISGGFIDSVATDGLTNKLISIGNSAGITLNGPTSISSALDSSSISTGSFVVSGGLGIAKNLYVGTNIFLAGNAVATQSFVTGLGYLTIASASGIYQPLIAGAAISALSLNLTGTSDSTSISTGTFTTSGGIGIAKSLYVGTNIFLAGNIVATQSYVLSLGYLTSASASGIYQPLIAGTAVSALTLNLTGTLDSSSISTGSFTTSGGIGISKSLYVGTNIFLAGNAVATQNFVTNFGYLTSASAAAIYLSQSSAAAVYQPLVAGTAIFALTLSLTGTSDSTSVLTGSFVTAGGLAIAKTLYVGTKIVTPFVTNIGTTSSNSSTTGSLILSGGIGLNNTTDAVNSTNGGTLTTSGGVAIAKSMYVGGLVSIGLTLNMNSNKILNLATPTLSTDAANKGYVDSIAQGLSAKNSTVVASTAPLNLSTGFSAGSIVDGITLTVGMRILIKDQSLLTENGIYLITSTAPTRTSDFPAGSEQSGAYFFVESGTTNGDYGFVCVSIAPNDVVGTSISFSQFSGAGQITAGTGLTKSGSLLSVIANQTQVTQVGTLLSLAVSGLVTLSNTNSSTSALSGSFTTSGGIGLQNTTDSVSSTNGGSFTTSGGMAIAKSLYVGTNIFLSGNAIATQSYVTGLGYLTATSAASVYQPLVANTAISVLTLSLTATNDSTSVSSGSFTTSGGAGISKKLYLGSDLVSNGNFYSNTSGFSVYTNTTNNGFFINSFGDTAFNSTTDSASLTSGSINTAGGMGISKSLNVGSRINIVGSYSGSSSNISGIKLSLPASSFTDISTATSSTSSSFYSTYYGISTVSALNFGVVTPIAANVYIAGAPLAGNNETITKSFSLLNASGVISSLDTTISSSSSSASLLLFGGFSISNTTDAINNSNGGTFTTAGGVAIAKSLFVGGLISVSSTIDSTSVSSGSFVTSGGIGVAKNIKIGGGFTIGSTKFYTYNAQNAGSMPNIVLNFNNFSFYAKITAQLYEQSNTQNVSTLTFECNGGNSSGVVWNTSIHGPTNSFPWSSSISSTSNSVSFNPFQSGSGYIYYINIEVHYGTLQSISQNSTVVQTYNY